MNTRKLNTPISEAASFFNKNEKQKTRKINNTISDFGSKDSLFDFLLSEKKKKFKGGSNYYL